MGSEDELARRLAEAMDRIPVPPGLEERVAAAARAEVAAARGPRRRRRARLAGLAAAALVLAGAGSAGTYWIASQAGAGFAIPGGPLTRAAIDESRLLARASWIRRPADGPHLAAAPPMPSLAFPAGTSYATALDRLLRSLVTTGGLPAGARLAAPLPSGVVWAVGSPTRRPRLDLRAPWGYEVPDGRIRAASVAISGRVAPAVASDVMRMLRTRRATGHVLPAGIRVDVPALPACQVELPGGPIRHCPLTPPAPIGSR